MIEALLLDYLNERASVRWYGMRPKNEPERYGLIDKTGMTGDSKLSTSTFACQSYAPTLLEAAEISAELRGLLEGAVELAEITRVELTTEYNFTNTETRQPRYQAVFEVTHY